jgi:integrase
VIFSPRCAFNVFTMVIGSAKNEKGEALYPYKWDPKFLDLPKVNPSEQHRPAFTAQEIERIIEAAPPQEAMFYALLAATGVRLGEALGLEIQHFNDDTISIEQALWNGRMFTPKTENGIRVVDLPQDFSQMLR